MSIFRLSILLLLGAAIVSCTKVTVNAVVTTLPKQEWPALYEPRQTVHLDTGGVFILSAIVRHNEMYAYNNLVATLVIKDSATKTIDSLKLVLPLTQKDGNWSGNKMDDLYDHEIKIKLLNLKSGQYFFRWRQLMQEDVLKNILNVGFKLDKHPAP